MAAQSTVPPETGDLECGWRGSEPWSVVLPACSKAVGAKTPVMRFRTFPKLTAAVPGDALEGSWVALEKIPGADPRRARQVLADFR